MQSLQQQKNQRVIFVLGVLAFVTLHLSLEIIDGGVRTHYPLMREDLPPLSNWWGLLILPLLGWVTHTVADKEETGFLGLSKKVYYRLGFGLASGAMLATAFELGLGDVPLYVLLTVLLIGLFYPLYRAGIMLGFVVGMSYTFGAVIPTVVFAILATISLVCYNAGRFLLGKIRPDQP